jgi:hypothetical protein
MLAPDSERADLDATAFGSVVFDAPEFEAPQLEAPQLEAPQLEARELDAPEFNAPDFGTTCLGPSGIEAPRVSTPSFTTPAFNARGFESTDRMPPSVAQRVAMQADATARARASRPPTAPPADRSPPRFGRQPSFTLSHGASSPRSADVVFPQASASMTSPSEPRPLNLAF